MSAPARPGTHRDRLARTLAYGFGLTAERLAAFRFRLKGYRILAHRFRTSSGEIDLVARRGARLAFIEVKARRGDAEPHDLVSPASAARIRAAADDFVVRHPRLAGCEQHFILVVVGGRGLSVHRDAF